MKKLPLDIQTFTKLRELNYLYVDKTEYAYNLISNGQCYFLSRPRRFGKSLFVSTLQEILSGNKELFDDLWISKSDYEWKKYGVISLSLSSLDIETIDLFQKSLCHALQRIAEKNLIDSLDFKLTPKSIFINLIEALHKKYGGVAILIDEYDYPILRTLDNPKYATEIRDVLRDFFVIIKDLDAYINFVFITGVSSFAKAGIFSGLNNLRIITLNNKFADILGYTDSEIDFYFKEHIQEWANSKNRSYEELRKKIKVWYNGYRFGKNASSVYNPFSLMNALDEQDFKNFWMQSGTPKFLVDILKKQHTLFDVENLEISEDILGVFNIGATPLIALMFQTGYLTIISYDEETNLYKLNWPNEEVRIAFQKYLLEAFAKLDLAESERLARSLRISLNNHNIEEIVSIIQQLFAHVAYQIHAKEEKYYHSLLQMIFIMAGIQSNAESPTAHGRIDLVLDMPQRIYIIEIKCNESAQKALAQIEERRYWEKFLHYNKPITLLGLSFNKKAKNFIVTYEAREISI